MKKTKVIVAVFALMAFSSVVFAQEFGIGIKGGPNFANLDPENSAEGNYKSRTGFHLGAFALIRGEKIGFQPEILFSQQGSTFKYSGDPDINSNFSYMNIPLILKLYTVAGINLQVGPQIGLLTSAKRDNVDIRSELKSTDISLALGVGWDLPLRLSIDARYNWGLSDIEDDIVIGQGSGAPGTTKNQVWQFSLGYKFFKFGNRK